MNSKRKKQIYLCIRSCLKECLGKTGADFFLRFKVLSEKTSFPLVTRKCVLKSEGCVMNGKRFKASVD